MNLDEYRKKFVDGGDPEPGKYHASAGPVFGRVADKDVDAVEETFARNIREGRPGPRGLEDENILSWLAMQTRRGRGFAIPTEEWPEKDKEFESLDDAQDAAIRDSFIPPTEIEGINQMFRSVPGYEDMSTEEKIKFHTENYLAAKDGGGVEDHLGRMLEGDDAISWAEDNKYFASVLSEAR